MRVPNSAAMKPEEIKNIPELKDVVLNNPCFEKKQLTRMEALDLINVLSMELMIDEKGR